MTPTGRAKLIIDVGGRKVNPAEVEAVLAEHPAVGACAVVGVAVSETVFRLKAVVTAPQGHPPLTGADVEDLRQFARQRLARYKVPLRI